MPIGVMNAPSTFQRIKKELVVGSLLVIVYLHEVIAFSQSPAEHVEQMQQKVGIVA